jgi:hypothetical protein
MATGEECRPEARAASLRLQSPRDVFSVRRIERCRIAAGAGVRRGGFGAPPVIGTVKISSFVSARSLRRGSVAARHALPILTVWAARLDLLLALPVRQVLAGPRPRVHRRKAQRPPELPADQAQ